MEAKEAGTATCTAVQQPHTEPSLTPQHRKWIRAAFLQAFAALVSKSSGVLMLLLPGSPVLTRALSPGPCAAPAPPWVPLCRGSPGTGLGLCAAGTARTALKQSPAPSPLQPPCFTSSSPRYSPKRVLHRALGPAVLRKAPTGAARGVTAGLWHTGTVSWFCTSRERSCGCCSRARAMEPPTRRELPQHPLRQRRPNKAEAEQGKFKVTPGSGHPRLGPHPQHSA